MQPDNLYNQLRFNLEQPYDINKMSVRHKKPSAITIEKAGPPVPAALTQEETDRQLAAQLSTVSLEKLKEAQFLAKRQLKKQKDEELQRSLLPEKSRGARPKSPAKPAAKVINKKTMKITPTKKFQHMPAAGNSPPVRDLPSERSRQRLADSIRRNLVSPLGKTHRVRGVASQRTAGEAKKKSGYKTGVVRELLSEDEVSQSMPDLHKMAMDQLIRVQSGEVTPPRGGPKPGRAAQATKPKSSYNQRRISPPKRRQNQQRLFPSSASRPRSASPSKGQTSPKYMSPSRRAEAARVVRERIYSQPLANKTSRLKHRGPPMNRAKQQNHKEARVLRRHPQSPRYDPDYSYIDPEAVLHEKEEVFNRFSQGEKSRDLPNADEFIRRITDARRENEMAEQYTRNPKKLIDQIERETRERLEPLIEQAQRLSQNMMRTASSSKQRHLYTVTPQYNGGHESRDMSGDDLLHHPVDMQNTEMRPIEPATENPGPSGSNIQSWFAAEAQPGPSSIDIAESGPRDGAKSKHGIEISINEVRQLKSMLSRLDEMQTEHVDIRNRWMTAYQQYAAADMINLEGEDGSQSKGDATQGAPRPLLLTKARTGGAKPKKILATKSAIPSARGAVEVTPNTEYREILLSLPEKKVHATEESKKRFQKHLNSICHTPSTGFDPWRFADQTADDILNHCITQVAQEILLTGDELIQGLYADEFIPVAANHSNTSMISSPS